MSATRQVGDVVGDYELVELLSAGAVTRSWRAKQISVQREVILDLLKKETTANADAVSSFLADVRAKARLDHPNIGLVYEARHEGEDCYYARETLPGDTLEGWHADGRTIQPLDLVLMLEPIADAQLYLEKEKTATVAMAAHHVHLTENGTPRLVNLAVAGERDEQTATLDKQLLGEILHDLLEPGHPGSTRTGSLCDYMADAQREIPLTWRQIRDLSRQVKDQLTATKTAEMLSEESSEDEEGFSVPSWVWALLIGVGAIAALVGYFLWVEGS